jgi:hypothetical protein
VIYPVALLRVLIANQGDPTARPLGVPLSRTMLQQLTGSADGPVL